MPATKPLGPVGIRTPKVLALGERRRRPAAWRPVTGEAIRREMRRLARRT